MSTISSPPPQSASALAPAQLKAQLWADASQSVYAVMLAERIPDLPARLAAALDEGQLQDFDCLRPGALEPEAQATAPYLALLKRDSAFTDWLLFEATAGLGAWGVIALSPAKLLPLRGHLRAQLQAQLPGGAFIDLLWMDPVILKALLPLFEPAALGTFMGPLQSLVITEAASWTHFSLDFGQLKRVELALATAS